MLEGRRVLGRAVSPIRKRGMGNSETTLQLVHLQMAEGHRESVGGVGRLGKFAQAKLRADHELYLALIGVPVSGDARFNLARRVAVDMKAVLFGSQEDHAADLGETEGGTHVERGENGFDGEHVGLKSANQVAKAGMNIVERGTGRHLPALDWNFQRTVEEGAASAADAFNYRVTGGTGRGRINTEYTQGRRVA